MKPYFLPLFLTTYFFACSSPAGKTPKVTPSPAYFLAAPAATSPKDSSQDANNLRAYWDDEGITVPPYGLDRVTTLICKIESVDDTLAVSGSTEALSDSSYSSLSFDEKFTYHMIHQETYSQNCEALPERLDEDNRIYGELPDYFGEYSWSRRQLDFFRDNRDSVEELMKSLIEKNGHVGGNFLEVIAGINGKEMIPFLVDAYRKGIKDHYILTTLMLLMEKNNYPEFMKSISYQKLYNLPSDSYSAYLTYNKANEDLIISRANNFYNGLSAK
jgi:hypothetical protein